MKNDAERRISLVNTMNGVAANIKTAEARDTAADARLASAQESLDTIKAEHEQRQTAMRAKYKELYESLDTLDTPEARTEAMTAINEVLSELEHDRAEQTSRTRTATHAFNNAKSEKGTATRELDKLREELASHQTMLNKLLPSPESLGA
jgi:DNA repair exonuclease SbcCD ATPase subunit